MRYDAQLKHGRVLVGKDKQNGEAFEISPNRDVVLVCGASGSGRSTAMTGIVERIGAKGYQFFLVDPEGDYDNLPQIISHGTEVIPPDPSHLLANIESSLDHGVVANLLGLPLADRPHFYPQIMQGLTELRHRTGRPQWIVIDEAHHMLSSESVLGESVRNATRAGVILVTVHPKLVNRDILEKVDSVLAMGETAHELIEEFCEITGRTAPPMPNDKLDPGEALTWSCGDPEKARLIVTEPGKTERRRHIRKYAGGELPEDRSFYFVGSEHRLNLRAHNLLIFTQIADGVDDDTWSYHLRQHDYSRWIEEAIKDHDLAAAVAGVEGNGADPKQSREAIKKLILEKYTL